LLVGIVTAVFGNTTSGISAPLGSFPIGAYRTSRSTRCSSSRWRSSFGGLALRAVLLKTRLGLIARGTMQNAGDGGRARRQPEPRLHVTFRSVRRSPVWPAACSRRFPACFPTMGGAYIAKAFITVIGGGAAIVSGTGRRLRLFGAINQIATFLTHAGVRRGGAAAAAIVLMRLLPQGITGRFFGGAL
jgi:urea transport system permease protein